MTSNPFERAAKRVKTAPTGGAAAAAAAAAAESAVVVDQAAIFADPLVERPIPGLLVRDGWLGGPEETDQLWEHCRRTVVPLLERDKPFTVYGRKAVMHRAQGLFTDDPAVHGYSFSGVTIRAQPLTAELAAILRRVNVGMLGLLGWTGNFNAILVNEYRGRSDRLSPHSDDERLLGAGSTVVGLTLGERRIMRFRRKDLQPYARSSDGHLFFDIVTRAGQLYAMYGPGFQREQTHEILAGDGDRISLTFRRHVA